MATKILICLAIGITPTLCDLATYVYTDNCAPPFNDTTGLLTTPSPGSLVYPGLQTIERCCPQCEKCKHLGGSCHLKWALELYDDCICDFTPVQPCRDYSCKCCIVCQDDKCSDCTDSGGECRKECRANELEDTYNACSYSNNGTEGCKCCKKCEATSECVDAFGICRTSPDNCPFGTYPSTGCCRGCTCCKPVPTPEPDSRCALTPGSYCLPIGEEDCADGYFACRECISTLHVAGLSSTLPSYCCIPKNAAPLRRIGGKTHHKIAKKMHHNIDNKNHHNYDNLVAEQAHKFQTQNRHPRQF